MTRIVYRDILFAVAHAGVERNTRCRFVFAPSHIDLLVITNGRLDIRSTMSLSIAILRAR